MYYLHHNRSYKVSTGTKTGSAEFGELSIPPLFIITSNFPILGCLQVGVLFSSASTRSDFFRGQGNYQLEITS